MVQLSPCEGQSGGRIYDMVKLFWQHQIDYITQQSKMKQNIGFNFTEDTTTLVPDGDFKKQRAAYLAQRNARKKQAEECLKRGNSTSSDDVHLSPQKVATPIKFIEKVEEPKTAHSSNKMISHSPIPLKPIRSEREIYRAQREAHRQEAKRNKLKQFGSSSSEDDETAIQIIKPPMLLKTCRSEKQESFGHSSKDDFTSSPFLTIDGGHTQKEKHSLHLSARLRMNASEKKNFRERYEIEVPSKKGVNVWLQKFLEFKEQTIDIGDRNFPIYDITKIKLFFSRTSSGHSKMKICFKDEDVYLAVDHKKLNELCLDHYYYFFAKIISLKLQLMGKSPSTQTKPKLELSEQKLKGAQIAGKVRKSSFFGGWQESASIINQNGMSMYREGKSKPILVMSYKSVRQIWTRFDFNNQNLIIKVLHNSSKVEISIPFQNFLSRDNWLYHIYNLADK